MKFTIGCDPELFVVQNGKFVSAHGLIPGDKKTPHKVELGAVQVDGMAVEMNTDPVPLETGAYLSRNAPVLFSNNVLAVRRQLDNMLKEKGNYTTRICGTADFEPEYLEAQPDEAKELGCDPDFCAYTGEANPRPNGKVNFRTAAGHIHIGWGSDIPVDNPEHMEICMAAVKVLDATVGLASVVLDRDTRRRELYGKAGAFRPKSYGVEYRTPSNFWLTNDPYRKEMYRYVYCAMKVLMANNGDADAAVKAIAQGRTPEQVRELIDTDNLSQCAYIAACNGYVGNQSAWKAEALKTYYATRKTG